MILKLDHPAHSLVTTPTALTPAPNFFRKKPMFSMFGSQLFLLLQHLPNNNNKYGNQKVTLYAVGDIYIDTYVCVCFIRKCVQFMFYSHRLHEPMYLRSYKGGTAVFVVVPSEKKLYIT